MSDKAVRPPVGVTYAVLYPFLAMRAREKGYALALHGTVATDMDLVAVPWTEEAASADELVAYLLQWMEESAHLLETDTHNGKVTKPHGRRVWTIHLKAWVGAYIDLSVMPLRTPAPAEGEERVGLCLRTCFFCEGAPEDHGCSCHVRPTQGAR